MFARGRGVLATAALGMTVLGWPGSVSAEVVWVGDLETADTSQFSSVLNGSLEGIDYLSIIQDIVAQGDHAARIELGNDAVWPNGLKRVELQHRPDPARTGEGATTFFAWSFYLPETLPSDPDQQIGYWESTNSFQQVMAFQVAGESITFSTRRPSNAVQWSADGLVTAGQWHRIAMRVLWSTDENVGEVDVWFDGEHVVTAAGAQTLADTNAHFVQFGLLRGAIEFDDAPVIYVDDAVEGDSLDDVRFDELPSDAGGTGGSSGGDDDTGSGGGASTTSTTGPSTTGGVTSQGASTGSATTAGSTSTATDGTDSAGATDDDDGCSCRSTGPQGNGWLGWMAGLLVFASFLRRTHVS